MSQAVREQKKNWVECTSDYYFVSKEVFKFYWKRESALGFVRFRLGHACPLIELVESEAQQ
jgi:hypothetical protein